MSNAPTFAINNIEVSNLDIALMKGMTSDVISVSPIGIYQGSDHQPVSTTIYTTPTKTSEKGVIPTCKRSDRTITAKSTEICEALISTMLRKLRKCGAKEKLEAYYDKTCQILVSQWNGSRNKRPGRPKHG